MKQLILKYKYAIILLGTALLALIGTIIASNKVGTFNILCGMDNSCREVTESELRAFNITLALAASTCIFLIASLVATFIASPHKKILLGFLAIPLIFWLINLAVN